ncbi:hypothetical protein QYE76_018122 [Lolium multiflorum]|uniref:Integrase catalytic domain-containing protein n=1 Tax=Lolium multiflorum TaxID=4521 RepID=A0AAD8QJE6_LOLMU|nr:hypothetical protein QYE76_018122 [Lolium multiflorum]
MNPIIKPWPFRGWGMDMIGKINPPSSKGHVWVLAITDYFTKWVEAVPMKSVASKDVINFVKEHVIHRFGIPQTITTDGGSVFVSHEFRKFCEDMGIKLIRSSPYYAQANGQAEASNKSLIKLIKRKIDEHPRRWHEMEPYVQTETYDLENGGSLVFERDLYLVSEKLERPPPQFHGVRIHNTPAGEQQWMITADLKGSSEPPISERILFSFKAYSWVDGLAHALQEGLARVCGQNIAALRGSRFAHFARHDTMGEPMALSSHPVLKIHVQHLDFMLHETRKDLELTRVHSHRAQMALAHHADAIRLLAKDRRSLRLQRAKNVATITRLREKIRTLEVTVRTQQDQIQEMEEDGEDIQGGDDFLSDDNDFEDDEFTDEEDYEFLEAAEDGIIPIDVDEDNEE